MTRCWSFTWFAERAGAHLHARLNQFKLDLTCQSTLGSRSSTQHVRAKQAFNFLVCSLNIVGNKWNKDQMIWNKVLITPKVKCSRFLTSVSKCRETASFTFTKTIYHLEFVLRRQIWLFYKRCLSWSDFNWSSLTQGNIKVLKILLV